MFGLKDHWWWFSTRNAHIWSILLIKSYSKWCIHLSKSLFYIIMISLWGLQSRIRFSCYFNERKVKQKWYLTFLQQCAKCEYAKFKVTLAKQHSAQLQVTVTDLVSWLLVVQLNDPILPILLRMVSFILRELICDIYLSMLSIKPTMNERRMKFADFTFSFAN